MAITYDDIKHRLQPPLDCAGVKDLRGQYFYNRSVTNYEHTDLTGCVLYHCYPSGIPGAIEVGPAQSEEEVTLKGVDLERAYLWGGNFIRSDLREVNLFGAEMGKANLERASIQGANLRGADLIRANLKEANLTGANLQGADLRGVNLQDANLEGANLTGAFLEGADLRGADLHWATLNFANFRRANLAGANLVGFNAYARSMPDFEQVKYNSKTIFPYWFSPAKLMVFVEDEED